MNTIFLRFADRSEALALLGAVALGNAPSTPEVMAALRSRADDASALVREHVAWALARHAGA